MKKQDIVVQDFQRAYASEVRRVRGVADPGGPDAGRGRGRGRGRGKAKAGKGKGKAGGAPDEDDDVERIDIPPGRLTREQARSMAPPGTPRANQMSMTNMLCTHVLARSLVE